MNLLLGRGSGNEEGGGGARSGAWREGGGGQR